MVSRKKLITRSWSTKKPQKSAQFSMFDFREWVEDFIPETQKYKFMTEVIATTSVRILTKYPERVQLPVHDICSELSYGDYSEDDVAKVHRGSFFYEEPNLDFLVYKHGYYDGDCIESTMFVFHNDKESLSKLFTTTTKMETLKPGVYHLVDSSYGPQFNKVKVTDTEKPILVGNMQDKLVKDIQRFFESEQFYKDNNFPYKRGVLLYGVPGTGKSSSIKYIGSLLNTVTIILDNKVDLSPERKDLINSLCPDGCILAIEDIDGIEDYKRSELLNFLDGIGSPHKCYIMATTNYLERVDFAFSNRPSRFDMVLEVGIPDKETRRELFNKYFGDKCKTFNMENVLSKTEKFTGAYIKELFILFSLNDYTIEEAIDEINKRLTLATRIQYDDDEYIN